jgi:hypothetical protein
VSGHIDKLRTMAHRSRTRNQAADNFWTMKDLVRTLSAVEIIEGLRAERDEYIVWGQKMWSSSRCPKTGEKPEGVKWSDTFGDSAAGVNLTDALMGWNMAHHAAAQGKFETLKALLEWE